MDHDLTQIERQESKPVAGPPTALGNSIDITPDQKITVALKCLDLCRSEILERVKLSNQLVIVYLGGISALLGWIFTATAHPPKNVLPAVAAGLGFLSFSLCWILNENERMIEFLADYQKEQIAPVVSPHSSPRLWENSKQIKREHPWMGAMVAHAVLINIPNIALIIAAKLIPSSHFTEKMRTAFLLIAIAFTGFSCVMAGFMIYRRTEHRKSSSAP